MEKLIVRLNKFLLELVDFIENYKLNDPEESPTGAWLHSEAKDLLEEIHRETS